MKDTKHPKQLQNDRVQKTCFGEPHKPFENKKNEAQDLSCTTQENVMYIALGASRLSQLQLTINKQSFDLIWQVHSLQLCHGQHIARYWRLGTVTEIDINISHQVRYVAKGKMSFSTQNEIKASKNVITKKGKQLYLRFLLFCTILCKFVSMQTLFISIYRKLYRSL